METIGYKLATFSLYQIPARYLTIFSQSSLTQEKMAATDGMEQLEQRLDSGL